MTASELSPRDAEHLRLLRIFHFIVAFLGLAGLVFLVLHFALMNYLFTNPDMWKNAKEGSRPPPELLTLLKVFYTFAGFGLVIASVLNFLSAQFLGRKKHRTFSLVVAGLNCLQIPFGTVLGVFTIIILSREAVRAAHEF